MSTTPNSPKNEDEEAKPFIDLSSYYDDSRTDATDDLSTTISDEEAKKLVDDVFGQLGDNSDEDETVEAFVDAFFDSAVRNGMNQDEALNMVDETFKLMNDKP